MPFASQLRSPVFFWGLSSLCAAGTCIEPWLCLFCWLGFGLCFIRRPRVILIGAFLFLVVGVRASAQVRRYAEAHAEAAESLHQPLRCAFDALVLKSPSVRLEQSKQSAHLLVVTDFMDCEGRFISAKPMRIRVTLEQSRAPSLKIDEIGRGDRLSFVAQIAPERAFRNRGLSSAWPRLARRASVYSGTALVGAQLERGQGLLRLVDSFRSHVRRRIVHTYHPSAQALGRALVLGENDLNDGDYASFQQSGLMHLLAVSGTHLVIAVVGLMSLLRALLTRVKFLSRRWDVSRWVYLFGGIFSMVYADFSGGSGSARRAALMLALVSLWRVAGRKLRGLDALGGSLLVGIMLWPLRGLDYSFLLSALATLGLLFLGQPGFRFLVARWQLGLFARWLVGSVVATVSSTIPCLPLLCCMSDSLTWAALAGNILAGPLGELVALPACLLHCLCADWPGLEAGLAALGSGALLIVRAVALWSGELTIGRFHVVYPGNGLIAWSLALLMLWAFSRRWYGRGFGPLMIGLVVIVRHYLPASLPYYRSDLQAKLSVTVLDVGQGDAILLRKGPFTLLTDAGGYVLEQPDTGARVVLPYLRAQGISKLDVVAASHDHPDHINGLLSVVESHRFDEFWWPGEGEPSPKLRQILSVAVKKGARVRTAVSLCRDQNLLKRWQLRVIWPCEVPEGLSQNDLSFAFQIYHGKKSALLTGDIERRSEEVLVKRYRKGLLPGLRADLLKLAHHGSHTSSTPEFLDEVRPRFAVASAGIRNRFGHPRRQTLDRLKERGVTFLDTIRDGSVTWSTDGEKEWITTAQPKAKRPSIPPTAK